MSAIVRTVMIGVGGMARSHIKRMLQMADTTEIVVVSDPSQEAYDETAKLFKAAGVEVPPNIPNLAELVEKYQGKLDAAFIITPHAYHHDQTKLCLEAGMDVLLEKPMVMNAQEAESLIEIRDRTGRLLVVAFQGSLSPQIRTLDKMLRAGELGEILTISGTVWQNWGPNVAGTWRQVPELSGGGFLFDTGAHMLNTIADIAGEDFIEVAAWLDNNNRPVDTRATVMGKLASGAMVTIAACGETIPSCASEIFVFCTKGIVRTGQWGERLLLQKHGSDTFEEVPVPASMGVWEQFLAVRDGKIPNPAPPEIGLRMSQLWDAVQASAAQGGAPVKAN